MRLEKIDCRHGIQNMLPSDSLRNICKGGRFIKSTWLMRESAENDLFPALSRSVSHQQNTFGVIAPDMLCLRRLLFLPMHCQDPDAKHPYPGEIS